MAPERPVDVKVVYTAARKERRRRASRAGGSARRASMVVLGLLNLAAAAGAYYGTWVVAVPELRFKILMHTPLPGVPLEVPEEPLSAEETATLRAAQQEQATFFVGAVVVWAVLATAAAAALALAGGSLAGRGQPLLRVIVIVAAMAAMGYVAWRMYALWGRYQDWVPDHTQAIIGGVIALMGLAGAALARATRGLSLLAALVLIVSAFATAAGLYIGVQYEAFNPAGWPMSFWTIVALAFIAQSLWGWVLVPLSLRVAR